MVLRKEDMVTTLIHDVRDDLEGGYLDSWMAFRCTKSIVEVLTDLDNFANNQKFKKFYKTIAK